MFGIRQCLVLGQWQLRAEHEIRKSSAVQNPMHDHRVLLHLEIKPVFLRPETIQHGAVPFDLPEALAAQVFKILLADLELLEQFKLLKRPETRKLGRTDFIEHDLEHPGTVNPGLARGKRKETNAEAGTRNAE